MTKMLWQYPAIAMVSAVAMLAGTAADAQARREAGQAGSKQARAHRAGGPARPIRRLGRLYGLARRQEGLLRAVQADHGGDHSARPNRDPSYAFVSTRPAEKVKNEVSVIVGYVQKSGVDASATVGSSTYVMYTQNDGAWVKNAAEEAQMVEAMRKGSDLVVKSELMHTPRPSIPIRSRVSARRSTRWRRSASSPVRHYSPTP